MCILKGHGFNSQLGESLSMSLSFWLSQQKFGLSVVNETLESVLSMAMEAVSLLHGKQMMVYLWNVLLVFLARQSTTGSLTFRAKGHATREWDIWYCT